MAKKPYKFTAARAASLSRARAISAAKRRASAGHRINTREARRTTKAVGKTLSKGKFTPSVRFTRHSQSVKVEGRTRVIPGTSRRFAGSANLRFESIKQQTIADKAIPTTRIRHGRVTSKLANKTVINKRISHGRRGGRSNAV